MCSRLALLLCILFLTTPSIPVLAQESNLEIGTRLKEEGRCEEAIPYFDAAIEEGIDLYDAYMMKGQCSFELQRYDESILYASLADKIYPKSEDQHILKCKSYYFKKDFQQTVEHGRHSLAINPNSILGNYCVAVGLRMLEKHEDAIPYLDILIELDKNSFYYLMRSDSYYEINDISQSIADADQCLHINPNESDCTKMLMRAKIAQSIQ